MVRILRIAVAIALAFAFCAPASFAKKKKTEREFRLRISALSGNSNYNVDGFHSSTSQGFHAVAPGITGDLDVWFSRRIGFIGHSGFYWANYSAHPDDFVGAPIYYAQYDGSLAFRFGGPLHTLGPELALSIGPGILVLPDIRDTGYTWYYDRTIVRTLGIKTAFRVQLPISKDVGIEFGGFYTIPKSLIGGDGVLSTTESRSLGGRLMLDYMLTPGFGIGIGGEFNWNHVGYTPNGHPFAEIIDFNTELGVVSLSFRI